MGSMTQGEKYYRRSLGFSFLFLAVSVLFLLIFWSKLPPQVPLFYSLPWGIEQLSSPVRLSLFPISTAAVIGLIFLTYKFFAKEFVLVLIVSFTGVLYAFMACLSLIKIILMVI
jgi:hypothetical protein